MPDDLTRSLGSIHSLRSIDSRTGLKKKSPTGFVASIMNHVKSCIGAGIFSMGYALINSGLAIGVPIIIIIGLICLHCQHLLIKVGEELHHNLGRRPDFGEAGAAVFEYGPQRLKRFKTPVKILSNIILILNQVGILCVYVLFCAETMKGVAEENNIKLEIRVWIAAAFPLIVVMCSLLVNLRLVGYLSILANFLMLICILLTIYVVITDWPSQQQFEWIGTVSRLPMFISVSMFAFVATQVLLPLYKESEFPEKMGQFFGVLNIASILEIIMITLIGTLCYITYGKKSREIITLNFKKGVLTTTVKILLGLVIYLSYTLNIYLIIEALFPVILKKWGPFKFPRVFLFFFRLVVILVTFIMAAVLPMLGQLLSLVGAVAATGLGIILPTIFHMVLRWDEISWIIKVKNYLLLFLGLFIMISGVVTAIIGIYEKLS